MLSVAIRYRAFIYYLEINPHSLFCCSPWKKRWTGKGRPRSVARAARYPQTTDSRQIRWVFPFSGESSLYIYIHIYFQFIINYFLFSYPLFALHFYTYIYIPIYTYIIDNRYRLAHPQTSPGVARCGWDDDVTTAAPSPSKLQLQLRIARCSMYRVCITSLLLL